MNGHDPPSHWFGCCPFCGEESMHELATDRQCNHCGFRFRVTGWADG